MTRLSANLMVFFAFVHLMTVFFAKAYRKPREITWVSGCLLLFVATTFPVFFSPTNFPILYDHAENVWTLGGEYAISVPFAIYGNLNYVDSDGVESGLGVNGSTSTFQLPLSYYDISIGVRYVLGMGIFIDARGRFMEYQDDSQLLSGLDSYRADMFVLGLGYQF